MPCWKRKEMLNFQQCCIVVSTAGDEKCLQVLTHWGRATHMCVGNLTIIGSDNGLSPERRQAIIWTNAGILLIGPLGTNFSEILIEILTFSFKKMRLKVSSAKWRLFRLGLNELNVTGKCFRWSNGDISSKIVYLTQTTIGIVMHAASWQRMLHQDLTETVLWLTVNKLSLNIKKTHYMLSKYIGELLKKICAWTLKMNLLHKWKDDIPRCYDWFWFNLEQHISFFASKRAKGLKF